MAQQLWDAAAPLISVTEKHPFLVSMVDGTLNLQNFRYYVIQDALYLTDFADCLNRLGTKMKDDPKLEMHSQRLHELAAGAEEDEKELHRSFFKHWDIDASGVTAMPNTLLYTSYMTKIVATRPVAEGLAALLPCFWVYMHVGKCMLELREKLRHVPPVKTAEHKRPAQFDAWIDMYGGEDFEKEVKDFIDICDKVFEDVDEETFKKLEEHFIMSCKLEHMFWDQAQNLMQWPEALEQHTESKVSRSEQVAKNKQWGSRIDWGDELSSITNQAPQN